MVEVEKVICPHNSPLKLKKGEAIDIDHRLMQQEYTNLFPLNGTMGGRKTSCMACPKKIPKDFKNSAKKWQNLVTLE